MAFRRNSDGLQKRIDQQKPVDPGELTATV
jgi:hypothetical protein